jgi:hypothetical protein
VPLETLKALSESNQVFQEKIQKHLDHKAQVVAAGAAPVIKVFQECGYIDQAYLEIQLRQLFKV